MIVVDTGPLVAAAISSDINHRRYADLPLGLVDASVIALAEQLELQEIATLDRRHFSVVRPNHVDSFALLP
ncbi:hypothetical protein [Kribbella sp. NPDC051620]|uniref:hypothetical protein n=1 Tax=Kribbella sp. NPDC051620 TaxID=3364120 RepID=UPI00378D67B8